MQCFYIFTTRNVCKSFLRRCKPVNTVFILPRWHPAACQTMPACWSQRCALSRQPAGVWKFWFLISKSSRFPRRKNSKVEKWDSNCEKTICTV